MLEQAPLPLLADGRRQRRADLHEGSFTLNISRRVSPGNPNDLAASALATRVSDSGRGRTQLDLLDPGNCADRDAHSHRKGQKGHRDATAPVARRRHSVMPFLYRRSVWRFRPRSCMNGAAENYLDRVWVSGEDKSCTRRATHRLARTG